MNMDLNKYPDKCHGCARTANPGVNAKCEFCSKLEFSEEILCDLNRGVQAPGDFNCRAFQPVLTVVNGINSQVSRPAAKQNQGNFRRDFFEKLLDSDNFNYRKAVALQKLEENPDEEIILLKYHLVWNTLYRKPVFDSNNTILDDVHNLFDQNRTMIGGSVYLLWLAKDHVHLFIESDGRDSIETVANTIKNYTNTIILDKYPGLKKEFTGPTGIWDAAYFVETVG
jgi:putative transposase